MIKICPAHKAAPVIHDLYLGFLGTNPNLPIVPPKEAEYLWYCCQGDKGQILLDLKAAQATGKPLITLTLGDDDWSRALSPENKTRYFSPASDVAKRCVPYYDLGRNARIEPNPIRPLLASLRGSFSTYPPRRNLLKVACRDIFIEESEWWQPPQPAGRAGASAQRYHELLYNSRFAFCPRGAGRSSIRLIHAIRYHCIPVMIDDGSRPFGQKLDFAVRTDFAGLDRAIAFIRGMKEKEYQQRLKLMESFSREFLYRDEAAGCKGTLGYTEYVREYVERKGKI